MRNARHRGVQLRDLGGGRWVARFRDPVSGKMTQTDLAPLGLTNENLRVRWAITKAGAQLPIGCRTGGARPWTTCPTPTCPTLVSGNARVDHRSAGLAPETGSRMAGTLMTGRRRHYQQGACCRSDRGCKNRVSHRTQGDTAKATTVSAAKRGDGNSDERHGNRRIR